MQNAFRTEPHGFNTLRQPGYDATCALRHTARFRCPSNIVEYIREACWLEVSHPRRTGESLGEPRNRAITHRAHVAQFLSENYIGPQLTQERLVDCVNCAVSINRPPTPLVHFTTRQAGIVHRTMCNARSPICFFWEIAFMRNTNYLIHQP